MMHAVAVHAVLRVLIARQRGGIMQALVAVPRCCLLLRDRRGTSPAFEKTSAAYRRFRIPLHRIRSFLSTRYGTYKININ